MSLLRFHSGEDDWVRVPPRQGVVSVVVNTQPTEAEAALEGLDVDIPRAEAVRIPRPGRRALEGTTAGAEARA